MLGAATSAGHRGPHSRDANFLQVALSEGQEDAEVHILLLKHLQVLETADLLQQCGKVLGASRLAQDGRAVKTWAGQGPPCKPPSSHSAPSLS